MIENPQPAWLPLLLLALPGMAFGAYAVNGIIFPRDEQPLCTIPATSLVLALLPTHVLALAFGSLSIGLAVAWTAIGVAGYAWMVRYWKEFCSGISIERASSVRRVGVGALDTLPIFLPGVLASFHREANFLVV